MEKNNKKNVLNIIVGIILIILIGFVVINYSKTNKNESQEEIYEITYDGIKCLTPILKIFNNSTYEYYYSLAAGGNSINYRSGKYFNNIEKIISQATDSNENLNDYYKIVDKDKNIYYIETSNKDMNEFLESLNIKLNYCLSEE